MSQSQFQKTISGLFKKRFQNGTFKISYPPYGYENIDGKMVINHEQAKIVKYIFSEALAGKGTQKNSR